MERRLAAILAADVVGYSRLMETDEAGTLVALQSHRRELIDPEIASHHGRIVKLMGDGALVEFGSVVDAVACAIAIQRGMAIRGQSMPEERRIDLRIGVHLGDVIVEGEDIYGDGVNIAARLEGLAEPCGICLSRQAYDQVETKLNLEVQDLGPQHVKNIARPIQVYRITRSDAASRSPSTTVRRKAASPRVMVAAAGMLAASVLALGLWQPWQAAVSPASFDRMTLSLPDKPSIAVLPFSNMSGDPAQDYFVDGMTEDVITDLSKISGIFVIARNSSFSYKGRKVSARQVAEELRIRYVLQGSVRRAGDRVRVNAELIDTTTGGQLWAERYDGILDDIFALQDDITGRIVTALAVSLTGEELVRRARGGTENVEAHDAFLQGWDFYRRHTAADFAKAMPFFKKAIEIDPDYGRAYAALALVYWESVRQGYPWTRVVYPDPSDFLGFTQARVKAEEYTSLALRHPTPLAYQVSSGIKWSYRRFGNATADARQAVNLDPNDPAGHVALAWALIFDGQPEEALSEVERAMRLDPEHPQDYFYVLGMVRLGLGQIEEAGIALQRAQNWSPEFHMVNAPLAAVYAHLGDERNAQAAFKRYWKEWTFSVNQLDDILAWWPYRRERDIRRLGKGLIKVGAGSQDDLEDYIARLRSGGTLD